MYKHVIFDLDGTLLNTIDDLAAAGNWVCRNHGSPVHTVEEYKYLVGNGMAKLAGRFAPEDWRTPERIAALLEEGKTVAYITLGDPSIYSTYLYIHRRVLAMGYEARLIPGVPSFCAVAAALGTGLCEGSDRLLIVPASHRDVADCLAVDANLVFMKAGRELGALRQKLEEASLLEGAAMVENCGMEGERVFPRFAGAPSDSGYFSVVVVKRDGQWPVPPVH